MKTIDFGVPVDDGGKPLPPCFCSKEEEHGVVLYYVDKQGDTLQINCALTESWNGMKEYAERAFNKILKNSELPFGAFDKPVVYMMHAFGFALASLFDKGGKEFFQGFAEAWEKDMAQNPIVLIDKGALVIKRAKDKQSS